MSPRALEYGMKVFKLKPIIFKSEDGRFRDISLDIDTQGM
jgi:hypothetical protein